MLLFSRLVGVILIVVLLVAIALISTLNASTVHVLSFADAQAVCGTAGKASCDSAGELPLTWGMNAVDVNGTRVTCALLRGCSTCESCGFS